MEKLFSRYNKYESNFSAMSFCLRVTCLSTLITIRQKGFLIKMQHISDSSVTWSTKLFGKLNPRHTTYRHEGTNLNGKHELLGTRDTFSSPFPFDFRRFAVFLWINSRTKTTSTVSQAWVSKEKLFFGCQRSLFVAQICLLLDVFLHESLWTAYEKRISTICLRWGWWGWF